MSNGRPRALRCRAKRRARSWPRPGTRIWRRLSAGGARGRAGRADLGRLFTEYLRACRDERFAMSLLPPGRFLMPGDLAGSPALTFAPLDVPADGSAPEGSLWAMMVRRYEAYKDVVVRPFFRDHFARLDRQIVLVDALAAFNAGPEALHDLEARWPASSTASGSAAARSSPACSGRASTASCSRRPRPIICIIPAMTGWRRCCAARSTRAAARAEDPGAAIDVVALAAVRATREAHGRARPRQTAVDPRHARAGESANGEILRRQHRGRDLSGRSARGSRGAVQRRCAFRGLSSDARPKRAISASCASARRCSSATAARSPPCLTSASTAPCSS